MPRRALRFVQLDTFYPRPLERLYGSDPTLARSSFARQMEAIRRAGFAAVHTVAPYLAPLGYDAHWLIGNWAPTQTRWVVERGGPSVPTALFGPELMRELVRTQLDALRPEVLYTTDPVAFDGAFVRSLRHRPALVLGWQASDLPAGTDWSGFDLILTPLAGLRRAALELGARAAESFYPGFPRWLEAETPAAPEHDLVFCGQWTRRQHSRRNAILAHVAGERARGALECRCAYYLSGETAELPREVAALNLGERYGVEMHAALRGGRMGLDARADHRLFREKLPPVDVGGNETANMRIIECTGSGLLLLTEPYDNLPAFFEPGREVETYRSAEELCDKLRYYLAHETERDAIARRGQERCLREHSMERRLEALDGIVRRHLSLRAAGAAARPRDEEPRLTDAPSAPDEQPRGTAALVAPDGPPPFERLEADDDLVELTRLARERRFGRFEVHFRGLRFRCNDLLSFCYSARDIFLHRVYDFACEDAAPVVIDGGGHLGLFTVFVKQRYPRARVTVFEPSPEALPLLRANLAANAMQDGVTVIEAGLFERDGEVAFGLDGSDGSSIYLPGASSRVPVVRLSRYLGEAVDFLKLNIEGAEAEVIDEIARELPRVRRLVIEYHDFPETGQRLHRILERLARAGFRYLLHDLDADVNPATKPPFHLDASTRFFLLIFAERLFPASVEQPETRLEPVSRSFGFDRGLPIDRYYIEKFLARHAGAIRGRVLEIGDNAYTTRFGAAVERSEVLNAVPSPSATIVGDLASGQNIPDETFDCIILTQTLQVIYDVRSALRNALRALRPGGVLLLTASGLSQISRFDMDRWGEFWRFTDRSLADLLAELVPRELCRVESFGNVAAAKAFLDGRARHELADAVLDHRDPDYQILLAACVTKPGPAAVTSADPRRAPLILLYHRIAEDPVDAQLLAVSPRRFDAHLRELKRQRRVVSLAELCAELRAGRPALDTAALTFDDGYADNLTHALPLLAAHGVPATIFVTSGMVGSDREFWWDALQRLFWSPRPPAGQLAIGGRSPRTLSLATPGDRLLAYDELCRVLKSLPPPEIEAIVDQLLAAGGIRAAARPSHRALSASELRALAASPLVEIGSHTVSHPSLAGLAAEAQQRELVESRRALEALVARPVRLLSYPFGTVADFGAETQRLAAGAGYEAGIANVQGAVRPPLDLFALPRLVVRSWEPEAFARWLRDGSDPGLEEHALASRRSRLAEEASC